MSTVAGILLAAGAGRRMGGPKALLQWENGLLVEHAIQQLEGCDHVFVVLGAAAVEVQERADLGGVTVVPAEDWQVGMGASLKAGLTAAAGYDAAVIALVDQPHIGPEAVLRLRRAYELGATAAVATYDGKPRNPVLLDRRHWPAVVKKATGDAGAREWLRSNPDLVTHVDCDGTGRPDDLDTPADYSREVGLHV